MNGATFSYRSVENNGVNLAVVDEGEGSPVVLLHGFPDSARMWRHQIPALVAAGHRVIAPDLRGFGRSDKPADVDSYGLRHAVHDLVAVTQALGVPRAHIVGHDWGAAVAWMYACLLPRRVDHLAVLSVGHPNMFLEPSLEQREKSWYMLLFQFPEVAEALLRRNSWRLFRQLHGTSPDYSQYLLDFSRPAALTAGLNWYRANRAPVLELAPRVEIPPVLAPTLAIWSTEDTAIAEATMTGSARFVQGPWRYERVEGAGHWIALDAPDRVTELLLGFLGSHEPVELAPRRRRL